MAAMKAYVLLFTAFFFSGLMQLSMAQDKPAMAAVRVIDMQAIDQAIAYLLMQNGLYVTFSNFTLQTKMVAVKAYVLLFTAFFFSGLMQPSMAQDKPAMAAAWVIDTQAIDQAIAYLLMFVALFVTYFAS
ncbi:hypothetical protein PR202_gb05679 [Eleusine coracana subsp. coracana]|uniref:Uncharacterized protein n=1 Tax=Eleusine coracana subsp. coracana TaxID=191504 RepID=A0AAV5E8J6_ELECO|nr:hypothetical protein QOZ80_1BG0073120 [Eleusine coracana subsp. coracana]GJN18511.1 hypothetical protein PR202_gb05679 [Eleusine coracana subsp. coracana]